MGWVPLHVHSQYSILNSTASTEGLVNKAANCQLPAIALTDEGGMYGVIEFYKSCKKVNIKPIIGCELQLAPGSRLERKKIPGKPTGFPLVLLAKNRRGYRNLCKLSSFAHVEGFYYTPRIDKELLAEHSEGLVCLSGPLQGLIPHLILNGKEEDLFCEIEWFSRCFNSDFYFELQRHVMMEESIKYDLMENEAWLFQNYKNYVEMQERVVQKLIQLGKQFSIQCVATNEVHYLERNDWRAHEILMNIQSGEAVEIWDFDSKGNAKSRLLNPKRRVYFSHEFYFKTPAQMEQLFSDFPEAVSTSLDIVDKIDLDFDFTARFYPVFTPSEGEASGGDYLKKLCDEGVRTRYKMDRLMKVKEKYPDQDPLKVVRERLSHELNIIISKGMCDYILIVHDFVSWAKRRGIPVGPGRGSGAGSLVLFSIGITDIEPLRFNLFFERFINPERPSYPDIDVDICMERRGEVIDYTVNKYGKERVAQIITFGTMKAKMAVKDVGRVLSIPLAKVNMIAKLIPEDPGMTLDKALHADPDLRRMYDADSEVKMLIDLAKSLEGSIRNVGVHAAGLVISGDPLTDHIPVCLSKESDILTTQFSMKPVESMGLLKVDFLGLKTLTAIQKTTEAIAINHKKEIDWVNLSLEDLPTFTLMNEGRLNGIFQMESAGMQELAKQLQIDKFEEIIAVVALYRPGPMEMIPSFIQRKHGKETIEIDHPLMKEVLAETYGIMVYQEQVMQMGCLLANYTLGEGDVLRRAMGKKDKKEMMQQRGKFQSGALKKGIKPEVSMKIFDKIERFASYGFNKSHAAAYGYLAYVTAYLKANYPKEWMAALMTCDRDDLTKVAKFIEDTQRMDISILPPDINESGHEFLATPKGIRFAMTAIKGVGKGVVEATVRERKRRGKFSSLSDFCARIDTKKVGKKVVQSLIEAGCFDFASSSRKSMVLALTGLYQAAVQREKDLSKGFIDLFASSFDTSLQASEGDAEEVGEVSNGLTLRREKELLGFYLTGHPLDAFQKKGELLSSLPFDEIPHLEHETFFRTIFIIEEVRTKISAKSQKKFAILKISNGRGCLELPIWPEIFEKRGELLIENQILYAILQIDKRDGETKLQCRWLEDLMTIDEKKTVMLDQLYERISSKKKMVAGKKNHEERKNHPGIKVTLRLNADVLRLSHILHLKKIFRSFSGNTALIITFSSLHHPTLPELFIDAAWGVSLKEELKQQLLSLPFVVTLITTP